MPTNQDLIQRNFRISVDLDSQLNKTAKKRKMTKTEVVQHVIELGLKYFDELQNYSNTVNPEVNLHTPKPYNSTLCAVDLQLLQDTITGCVGPITDLLTQILDVLQSQTQLTLPLQAQSPLSNPTAIENSSPIVTTNPSSQQPEKLPSARPSCHKSSKGKQTLKKQSPDTKGTQPRCPKCRSTSLQKKGKSESGKQRYFCKDCKKQFAE